MNMNEAMKKVEDYLAIVNTKYELLKNVTRHEIEELKIYLTFETAYEENNNTRLVIKFTGLSWTLSTYSGDNGGRPIIRQLFK